MKAHVAIAGILTASSALAQTDTAAELKQLRAQMQWMQQRIEQLESQQQYQDKAIHYVDLKARRNALRLPDAVLAQPDNTDLMTNLQNNVTGKPVRQLELRRDDKLQNGGVYLGGTLFGGFMGELSNTEDKFAILSRFPNQHSGSSGSRFVINQAALNVTATPHEWVTGNLQLEYTETEYPGQEDVNLRRSFVTIGNLKESPWYASFGRNNIDFGNMDSYNPFTHSMTNHYFKAESDDPVLALGYASNGLHVVATAINGGRQQRVAHHEDSNHIKNFAIKAEKAFSLSSDAILHVGASYLHSSIYNSITPHHTTAEVAGLDDGDERHRNGVYDVFVELLWNDWAWMAEFAQTTRDWPATDVPVWALTAQAEYFFENWQRPASVSLVYSHGDQGESGTEWERMQQVILGYETEIFDHVYFGSEYVFNRGFVPLINIRQTADRDVENHNILVGGRYVF